MLTPIRALLTGSFGFLVAASTVAAQTQTQGQPVPRPLGPSQRAQIEQVPNQGGRRNISPNRIQRLPATDQRVVQTAAQQPVSRAAVVSQDPFHLTAEQQAQVDQVLKLWETESDKISTYKCSFDRFEYDSVFLNGGDHIALTVAKGRVSYVKPDKGRFQITEIERYNAKTQVYDEQEGDPNEHWVCTGDAVYEYDAVNKQLKKFEIPPERQGKAIADGPLPFVFGAQAEKLKQRYWIRIIPMSERPEPSNEEAASDIWLDVRPKHQADATNYSRVQLILSRSEFLPKALQIYTPSGKQRTSYAFGKASVNRYLDRMMMIQKPSKPLTWKLVVEKAPSQAAAAPKNTNQPQQATRNQTGSRLPR